MCTLESVTHEENFVGCFAHDRLLRQRQSQTSGPLLYLNPCLLLATHDRFGSLLKSKIYESIVLEVKGLGHAMRALRPSG